MAYQGNSIVDYIKSIGGASDYGSRSALATKSGITGYTGSADQNTSLLNTLRTSGSPSATGTGGTTVGTPSGDSTQGGAGQSTGGQVDAGGTQPSTAVSDPNAAYRGALDSYLASLKGSDDMNTQVEKAQIDSRRQYQATLDAPGGLKSGAEDSAAVFNRRSSSNLADLGVAQDASTRATSQALERLKYEQGLIPKNDPFSLNPGESRYDAKGKLIASSAPKALTPSEQYGSGSIGEYNFAKSQGYKGSFTQYQNEDANRKARASGTGSTAPKTLEERNQQIAGKVSTLFSPGYSIPDSGGTPYVDSEGYATPEGWKTALSASGLTRSDFIKQFGYLISLPDGTVPSKYNLTATEKKLISG